jgi:hypothetical protein
MTIQTCRKTSARWLAAGLGACAGGYAACVGLAWWRFGQPALPDEAERDPLLDGLMPRYDIVERHRIRVGASAATTLAAAREMDLLGLPGVRTIFATREWILGAAESAARPRALLENVRAMGWRVLAEVPAREIVVGAITRPWEPNPVFVGMDADAFIACREPGVVKIAWTLRADDDGDGHSVFRTETRAVATDAAARARFRRYWSLVSPGVFLIRRLSLAPVRAEAERRARRAAA